MENSISTLVIRERLEFLEKNGVNIQSLIHDSGLDYLEIYNNDRIPFKKYLKLSKEISQYNEMLDNNMLMDVIEVGLHKKLYQRYPDLFGVCFNEVNALNAIQRYNQYKFIISDSKGLNIFKCENSVRIVHADSSDDYRCNYHCIGAFVVFFDIIKFYTTPIHFNIYIKGDAPNNIKKLTNYFGREIEFNSSNNKIEFDLSDMLKTNPIFNERLNDLQLYKLNELTKEFENSISFEQYVMRCINKILNSSMYVSDSEVFIALCSMMNISRWTLNRRLKSKDLSFTELLKVSKLDISKKLLSGSNEAIQQISELLCFSSQSNFTRFFKANMGITPLEYRNKFTRNY